MTITRQLLILLLVEVMLLGGIAHLVIGFSPLLSLLFVVLTLLGLRCLVVLLTWGFSRFYPAPAIGLRAWLRMVVWEMLAYLFTFTWLLPFERLLMTPDRLTPSPLPPAPAAGSRLRLQSRDLAGTKSPSGSGRSRGRHHYPDSSFRSSR